MDQLRENDRRLHRELFSGPVGVGDGTAAKLWGSSGGDGCGFLTCGPLAHFWEKIAGLEWAAEFENRLSG